MLAAATVLLQIAYPLVSGQPRDVLTVVTVLLLKRIIDAPFGYSLRAARDSEYSSSIRASRASWERCTVALMPVHLR